MIKSQFISLLISLENVTSSRIDRENEIEREREISSIVHNRNVMTYQTI